MGCTARSRTRPCHKTGIQRNSSDRGAPRAAGNFDCGRRHVRWRRWAVLLGPVVEHQRRVLCLRLARSSARTIVKGKREVVRAIASDTIAVCSPPLPFPLDTPPTPILILCQRAHTSYSSILIVPLPRRTSDYHPPSFRVALCDNTARCRSPAPRITD